MITGVVTPTSGEIKVNFIVDQAMDLTKDYDDVKTRMQICENGKKAITEFEVLSFYPKLNATLLLCKPLTGRQHQIRVHLFYKNHKILGDPLYGAQDAHSREYLDCEFITQEGACPLNDSKRTEYFGAARLMLHAYRLQFCYDNQWYAFVSSENFAI